MYYIILVLQKINFMNSKDLQARLIKVMQYLLQKDPIKFKTQSKVARYINYPQSNLSAALNGNDKYLTEAIVKKFTDKFPEINAKWFLLGSGQMIETDGFQPMENAKQIDEGDDYIWLETTKIPERVGLSLSSNYFAESMLNELEKGKIRVKKNHKGKYWEVEATGDSMNDNTSRSLLDGDWYAARDIPREAWKNKLHFNGWNAFYFLHNERGHFIKEVVSHDPETGIIELRSWNPDKETYPNFTINIKDCYIIANIVKLINRDYNIFYK